MNELIDNIYSILGPRINEFKNDKLELEFRLGYILNSNFNTDVTKLNWEKLYTKLFRSFKKKIFELERSVQKDIYYENYRKTIQNNITVYTRKDKLVNLNIETNGNFDIRISLSNEKELDDNNLNNLNNDKLFMRKKYRYTFIYKLWKYDLSIIELEINGIIKLIYEIELELKDTNIICDEKLLKNFLKESLIKITDIFQVFDNTQTNYTFKIK